MGLSPKPLRKKHRTRLRYVLWGLVNQHHWVPANGVLGAYMKGTLNDTSPSKNYLKFWVLMKLLNHEKNNSINPTIKNLYDIWSKKIGSMKTWPLQVKDARGGSLESGLQAQKVVRSARWFRWNRWR
ncbi:hypothetical protein ACSQ67_014448 [Phaseolus vulgaris]